MFPFSGTIIVLNPNKPTRGYTEPSEGSCCELGHRIADLGYKQCSNQRHSISTLDDLYSPGLAPARLVEKCQYLYYNDLSLCCVETRTRKEKEFKNLVSKTRQTIMRLKKTLEKF